MGVGWKGDKESHLFSENLQNRSWFIMHHPAMLMTVWISVDTEVSTELLRRRQLLSFLLTG